MTFRGALKYWPFAALAGGAISGVLAVFQVIPFWPVIVIWGALLVWVLQAWK